MGVEREFPLPKVLGNNGIGQLSGLGSLQGGQTGLSPFVPERHRTDLDLEHEPIPDFVPQPSKRVDHIRGWLKLLTHREMREFVKQIFDAHEQLFPQNEGSVIAKSIKIGELSDVLDKVAHDD